MSSSSTSARFPWYDSPWLRQYVAARQLLSQRHPGRVEEFTRAFDRLRTKPDFTVQHLDRVFDDSIMEKIREVARAQHLEKVKKHEIKSFGRLIVHNHPWFVELQNELTERVSALAGEPLEPRYNFLSLYLGFGVCPIHMDAPDAKWTLDLCIQQSAPWPIHFSQIVPWPENFTCPEADWQSWIKRSPDLKFTSHTLQPGQALLFSGSSQWHYREALSPSAGQGLCKLLFFHFVPKGTVEISKPINWPKIFGVPELAEVVTAQSASPDRMAVAP